jgi:SAM-dependent methyltransferase
MGFYERRVLPHLVHLTCGMSGLRRWRAEVAEGLDGTVLELGFGSGLNLDHLPDGVERVLAVEPSDEAYRMAAGPIARSRAVVERVGVDGRTVPLPDGSADHALVTFTLCTVPGVGAALAEVRRILRPGGTLHFLEHGLAPDPAVVAWQHRLEPVQRRLAGGCHLTRDPVALLTGAGFAVTGVTSRYGEGPRPWSYFSWGVAARDPGSPDGLR